ncbi:tetratricopeptide repeat protein [Actinokineospora sp. PR83]|uniref:tetratricopeptide repeat protein n=1 Tax=Actinokineospora sp. PR83 TaxID=2884908 RepID=UPI001F3D08CA|nr:tetratricopeptide repeat protein [Actinokineospora sp. PR83]MCG8917136.1 tetratricopeptide repeat protein [Actinokineospora sp. PR83]
MAEPIDAVLTEAAQLTAAGQPEAAISLLRPVLVVHPDNPAAWCRLAAALFDAGQPEHCLTAAKRAITLGERSWAHRLASLALGELGRFEEAATSAGEAARRDPDDWRAHVALAEAHGPRAPLDALAAARRAVEVAPDEARPHEVLGAAALWADERPLAKRAFTDALRLDPANTDTRAQLGRLADVRAARADPGPQVPFGRAQRIALWLLLRRCAGWLLLGGFLLLLAGSPQPSRLLVWFALALLLAVAGTGLHGVLGLPRTARLPLAQLWSRVPLFCVGAGLLGVGLASLTVWTVALAFGATGTQPLIPALVAAALSGLVCWVGLARMRMR